MIVWALPVVALLVGAGGLALALRRWQRQPRLVATEADEAFVAEPTRTERASPSERSERPRTSAVADGRGSPTACLEEEREFLLRSLDDLDAERADGNIDDETYDRLHADYTARAARVIHALRRRRGRSRSTEAPPMSPRRPRARPSAGIVAFALIAGVALAYGLGAPAPRRDHHRQLRRSNDAAVGRRSRSPALQAAVRAQARRRRRPTSPSPASYMGTSRTPRARWRSSRPRPGSIPTNPEPFAYSGWLIRLQGFPDQALTLIDKAVTARTRRIPTPTSSRASSCSATKSQPDAAIPEFQQYLVAAPDSPLADQVRQLLAEAVEAGTSGSSTSTTTPPTTSSP